VLPETSPMTVCGLSEVVHRRCVRIGGVSIGLAARSASDICLTEELKAFKSETPHCDIEISIEWAQELPRLEEKSLFDSGSVWTLYANDVGFIFDFSTPVLGKQPYKRLYVNRDFSDARLLLNSACLSNVAEVYPLEYPLDELLVTNWLALGRGVEMHGCGLVDHESFGHLFLGHSGAGKSTTSLLWKSLRDVRVLSDDRIILRELKKEIWMHGTPWHGEAGFAAPEKVRIRRIFILEHGEKNEVLPLTGNRAVAELFARCFPPFHGHGPLNFTLSYLHHIADSVPCYLFRFLPNPSAVEKILDFCRCR
jgi:hypothetical protein